MTRALPMSQLWNSKRYDDFNAPRIGHMLLIPIFSWPVKPKPAGDPTTFDVRWLLIASPDSWSRKV